MSNFNERLKKLRLSANLTQKQLGEAINASERGIQNYEAGQRKPTYEILLALANHFDVSIDYLMGNGLYAQGEMILQHKAELINALCNFYKTDSFKQMESFPDYHFLSLIAAIMHHIDFKEDGEKMYVELHPLLPAESGEMLSIVLS